MPSGIAAVIMATIPAFMALAEIVLLRTQKLTLRLAIAAADRVCGVAVLTIRSLNLGGAPVDRIGAAALITGAISWSVASALARMLPLPSSKVMSSGAQMLAGGVCSPQPPEYSESFMNSIPQPSPEPHGWRCST